MQRYALTDLAGREKQEAFYHTLEDQTNGILSHGSLIVTGDMHAMVGIDNERHEGCIHQQGMGEMNENGENYLDMQRD